MTRTLNPSQAPDIRLPYMGVSPSLRNERGFLTFLFRIKAELPKGWEEPVALGLLQSLWSSVFHQSTTGDVSNWSDEEIAVAARWGGLEARVFVEALRAGGFLVRGFIGNWDDGPGLLYAARRAARSRQVRHRQSDPAPAPDPSRHVTGETRKVEPQDTPSRDVTEHSVTPVPEGGLSRRVTAKREGNDREGNDRESTKHRSSPRDEQARRFAEFWEAYPRKVGKTRALEVFAKLGTEEQALAVAGSAEMAATWAGAPEDRRVFIPHPDRWLRGGRWNDDRADWRRQAAGPEPRPPGSDPRLRALVGSHGPAPPKEPRLEGLEPTGAEPLASIRKLARPRFDERDFETWIVPLRQAPGANGTVTLVAHTQIGAEWIRQEYLAELRDIAETADPDHPLKLEVLAPAEWVERRKAAAQ